MRFVIFTSLCPTSHVRLTNNYSFPGTKQPKSRISNKKAAVENALGACARIERRPAGHGPRLYRSHDQDRFSSTGHIITLYFSPYSSLAHQYCSRSTAGARGT